VNWTQGLFLDPRLILTHLFFFLLRVYCSSTHHSSLSCPSPSTMSKTAAKVGASRGRVGGGGGGVDASGNLIKPQWSTVISDGVLALCTLYACGQLYQAGQTQTTRGAQSRMRHHMSQGGLS
jgi:hypothetical protein